MSTQEALEKTASDDQGEDWFLQELIEFVGQAEGNEIGVTLHVEGAIVTGTLINGGRWFKDLAGHLEASGVNKGVSHWIAGFSKVYAEQGGTSEEGRLPPAYLHLRNARTVGTSGDLVPTDDGVFWRGRVNAVSGFSLGTLGPSPK